MVQGCFELLVFWTILKNGPYIRSGRKYLLFKKSNYCEKIISWNYENVFLV